MERRVKNFNGAKFWAQGYFVSTVGSDEETIRLYIRNQEVQDKQLDQFTLFTLRFNIIAAIYNMELQKDD